MTATTEFSAAAGVQSRFEGWAIVDVLGHQRYVGYVTTEYFGSTAFFRVATPARERGDRRVTDSLYPSGWGFIPAGSLVTFDAKPGSERLIGAGSIYGITPQTRENCIATLDEMDSPKVLAAVAPDGKVVEPIKASDDHA